MDTESIAINEQLALPAAEMQIRFTTGGGPGGQHVNKTATRVTLLFDVANSTSLDEDTRARLLDRLSTRLDRRGVLHIDVQESRSQWQNREAAVARLQALLAAALVEQAPRAAITLAITSLAESLCGDGSETNEGAAPAEADKGAGLGRWLNFWPAGKPKAEKKK